MAHNKTHHPSDKKMLWHSLGVILSLWRKRAWRLIFGVLLAIAALFCGLLLMQYAGLRLAGCVLGAILVTTALLRWVGIGRVVLRYGQRLFAHDAMFRALADLRIWFFKSLARGGAAGLGFRRTGDMLSRLVSDIGALDGLYLRIIIPLICTLIILPILGVVLLSLSLPLGGAIFAVIFMAAVMLPALMVYLGGRSTSRVTSQIAQLRNKVLDYMHGLREIRVYGADQRMMDTVAHQDEKLFALQQHQAAQSNWGHVASYGLSQLAILLLLIGIVGIGNVHLSVLGGIAVLFLLTAVFDNFSNLTQAGVQAGMMSHAARRVVDAAQAPSKVRQSSKMRPLPSGRDLTLKDVSFKWAEGQPWVLDGCNMHIAQGEHIAIIGDSGAGKSSIAALIMDVISPQKGDVYMGQIPYENLPIDDVRGQMAWISQQTHIFADTIRANLKLGAPHASDEQMHQALKAAEIDAFVRSLPYGLDTYLGEGGVNVSGGQGRRIALARTLLMDAPIVVLDEPTWGLDNVTARAFLSTLNDVLKDKTVLMITHQFYGTESLDKVLWLKEGQLNPLPI